MHEEKQQETRVKGETAGDAWGEEEEDGGA